MNAQQPKQVLYSPVPIDGDEYADFDELKSEEEIDFEKFRDEMRESNQYAKITVSRQPTTSDGRPGQQKLIFLFECGMDEFSFSQLCSRCRDEYGTGTYRIQARNEKGQLKINKGVQVEAPKLGDDEKGGSSPGDIIARVSEAMHQHQIRTEQMVDKLQPATSNPMGMLTELATAMATIMGTLGMNKEVPAPKTLLEQMTEYKMMQELFSGGDGSGGDDNLYSLLTATMKSFGGPIAAALAAGQTSGQVDAQGLLTGPKPNPINEEAMQEQKQKAETEALKGQIKILIANAEAKNDPIEFADLVVEKTPETQLDSLFDFLSGDDWFTQIVFLVPEAEPHKEWFTLMRDQVLKLLTVADDAPIVPESETVAENESTGSDIREPADGDATADT